jgi:hypothetical protein
MHATRERISLRKNKAVNFYTTMHNVSNIDIGIIYQTRIHQDEVGKKPSKKIILQIPSKLHQFSVLTREKMQVLTFKTYNNILQCKSSK